MAMIAARTFFGTPAGQLTPDVEEAFFTSLMTRNKTYKTTFRQRFADVNPQLIAHLQQGAIREIKVLDIGVSSGVSTIELYDDLRVAGFEPDVVATDILIDAFLVRILPHCHALVDEQGFPLRFDVFGATMKPWVTPQDYRNGFFVLRKGINVAFSRRARRVLRRGGDRDVQHVQLVTPRLLVKEGVVVCNDDITRQNDGLTGKFDFIRAANILNRGYFPEDSLNTIVGNITSYLRKASGFLLVLRTHEDRSNHGTLFRIGSRDRFEIVTRFGTGSEIEDMVLQCRR